MRPLILLALAGLALAAPLAAADDTPCDLACPVVAEAEALLGPDPPPGSPCRPHCLELPPGP